MQLEPSHRPTQSCPSYLTSIEADEMLSSLDDRMKGLQGSYLHFTDYCKDLIHNWKAQAESSSFRLDISESSHDPSSYLQDALNYIQSVQDSLKTDFDIGRRPYSKQEGPSSKLMTNYKLPSNYCKTTDSFKEPNCYAPLLTDYPSRPMLSHRNYRKSYDADYQQQRLREAANTRHAQCEAKCLNKLAKAKQQSSQFKAEVRSLKEQLLKAHGVQTARFTELERNQRVWRNSMADTEGELLKLREAVQLSNQTCQEKENKLQAMAAAERTLKRTHETEIQRLKEVIGKLRCDNLISTPPIPALQQLRADIDALKESKVPELPNSEGLLLTCQVKLDALEKALSLAKASRDLETFAAIFSKFRDDVEMLMKHANGRLSLAVTDTNLSELHSEIRCVRLHNKVVELELELRRTNDAARRLDSQEDYDGLMLKLKEARGTIKDLREELTLLEEENRVLRGLASTAKSSSASVRSSPVSHRRAVSNVPNVRSSQDLNVEAFDRDVLKQHDTTLLEALCKAPDSAALCDRLGELIGNCKLLVNTRQSAEAIQEGELQYQGRTPAEQDTASDKAAAVEEIERLSVELARLTETNSSLTKDRQRLEEQKKQLDAKIAELTSSNAVLHGKASEGDVLTKRLTELSQEVSDLQYETSQLKAELTKRCLDLTKLESELTASSSQLARQKSDLNRLGEESVAKDQTLAKHKAEAELAGCALQAKESEIQSIKAKLIQTEQALQIAEAESAEISLKHDVKLAAIRADMEAYDMRLADLKAENAFMELELDDKDRISAELLRALTQVNDKSAEINDLQLKLGLNDRELTRQDNELKRLTLELKLSSEKLGNCQGQLEQSHHDLKAAKQALILKEREYDEATQNLGVQAEASKAAIEQHKATVSEGKLLKSKLRAAEAELTEHRGTEAKLEASLAQANATCKKHQDSLIELRSKLRQVTEAKSEAAKSLTAHIEALASMEVQLSQTVDAKKLAEKQAQTSSLHLREVSRRLKASSEEVSALKIEVRELQAREAGPEITGMIKKYDDLIKKYTALKEDYTARDLSRARVEELEAQLKRSREEAELLQKGSLLDEHDCEVTEDNGKPLPVRVAKQSRHSSRVKSLELGRIPAFDQKREGNRKKSHEVVKRCPEPETEERPIAEDTDFSNGALIEQPTELSSVSSVEHNSYVKESRHNTEKNTALTERAMALAAEVQELTAINGQQIDTIARLQAEIGAIKLELEDRDGQITSMKHQASEQASLVDELKGQLADLQEKAIRLDTVLRSSMRLESAEDQRDDSLLYSAKSSNSFIEEIETLSNQLEVIKQKNEGVSQIINSLAAKANLSGRSEYERLQSLQKLIEAGLLEREANGETEVTHLKSELKKSSSIEERLRKELFECKFAKERLEAQCKDLGRTDDLHALRERTVGLELMLMQSEAKCEDLDASNKTLQEKVAFLLQETAGMFR